MNPSPEITSSPQYAALTDLVSATPPSDSLNSAIVALTQPTIQAIRAGCDADDVESSLWQAWLALVAVAGQTPHDDSAQGQARLVELVQRIAELPSPSADADANADANAGVDSAGKDRVWDLKVWNDLPVFGAVMRESWDFQPDDSSSQSDMDRFINLNAFAARLTTLSAQPPHTALEPHPTFDYSLYAIWTLRSALEDPVLASSAAATANTLAAAVWWLYAADPLWAMTARERRFERKVAAPGSSQGVNPDWRGFNRDRFDLWLNRMRDLVASDGMRESEDTRQVVRQALERMEGVARN